MSDRGDIVDWFLSTQGRITRIVAGSLLIIIGLGIIGGFFGVVLLIIGAVPIASAAYGTFLLAPFFGRGVRGEREGGAPTDEAPEPEDGDDEEAREDESGQESGGTRRGEESSEEPQEQLEKDAPGDTTATRDQDAGEARSDRTSSGGGSGQDGGDAEENARGDKPVGARPVRAERPPGQAPRTKDPRAEDSGGGESA